MSRSFFVALSAAVFLTPLPLLADSIALREIQELREAVAQQSKQLEALTAQVTKLNQTLEGQKAPAPSPAVAATETPAAAPVSEIPRAEAVPKHVVAKGETLTSIAKLYSIPITELQKLNKIENDRKLQIGQSLTLPSPVTPKPTEPNPEKKENP